VTVDDEYLIPNDRLTFDLSREGADRLEELVDAEAAHMVLWHFGERRAMEPGSFFQALVGLMAKADPINRAKLGIPFPGHAAGTTLAQNRSDGMDRLRKIAGIG
jgi:hypothetical protein